ncbi:hypothetical protein D9758_018169 [Tetrapyrgos nigripes]|uniref:Uncharacterized protein n=1 Tax=Tetrapyrgos nigripes TaxID=182062 RepID=A0A8H5F9B6_9AGAR|nr:hypothetical protein D9758_018169 [Tetrapyrgos nigripes]
MPPGSSNLPAAPVEASGPSGARRRRRGRAGPANANVTPVESTTPANQAAFNTMFNHSRHSEFHDSSLRSVGGDDRRSSVAYNISLSNITLAANTEVTIYAGQDGNVQQHLRYVGLETRNVGSQPAVRVVSRGRSDEAPSQARSGEFVLIGC